jgi:hypothetical protein
MILWNLPRLVTVELSLQQTDTKASQFFKNA